MQQKPALGFWQIWNMCFGFMGVQFGFALQNANVSRIFQTLGAEPHEIPGLWVAAPLTGLLVQPVIGYMSDRTWTRLGRRRPYFLYGALLSTAALFFMPHSPALWIAAGTLWILDASINVTMEPFRALVGDMLPERQRTLGFAVQSFFIGVGSVIASALPWLMTNWLGMDNTAAAGVIPDSVKWSFYLGGGALLLAVLWTVLRTREYSPRQLDVFAAADKTAATGTTPAPESGTEADTGTATGPGRSAATYRRAGAAWAVFGIATTLFVAARELDKELLILTLGIAVFGALQLAAGALQRRGRTDNGFYEVVDDIFRMPRVMKQLAVVQFFSWFALFAMWTNATPAITAFHFGSDDPTSAAYNAGADWVGILFAAYNGFAALAAFLIPLLAGRVGRRRAHLINLMIGGVGLLSIGFIHDPTLLLLSMAGVGVAWASILSLPYALLSSAVPHHKMGVYMGIFNFFIVIPQLTAASLLGLALRGLFGGEAIYALAIGGVSWFIAGAATLLVGKGEDG
jgi:maltose/moltooligosaccharide transporter